MIFKVSAIFAVATLAGVANAEGERFCNGSVDPADCSDLAGLCGNALISAQCPVTCGSCNEAPEVERRASARLPEITVNDGNLVISAADGKDVFIEGGDGVQVDLLAIEPAIQAELKASVDSATLLAEERERKSEQTTVELLKTLASATTESAAASKSASEILAAKLSNSIDSLTETAEDFFVQFINITLEGSAGSSSRRSTSAAVGDSDLEYATAYPHQVSDQGGHLIITFPAGTELIVESSIKIYHCEWTDGDKVTKVSEMVSAATPRSILISTPKWNAPGTLPSASSWDTSMVCYENGAKIAGPEEDLVFKWVPSHPAFKVQSEIPEFSFSKSKTERGLKVEFELDYPYGVQGYQDCVVTFGSPFKAKDDGFVQRPAVGGDTKTSTRSISFDLKGQDVKDPIQMEIPIVVTSKKTGFKSTTKVVFQYEGLSAFGGDQGNKDIMTGEAMEPIWIKIGRPSMKPMKLCYSSKRDGWSTSTFHRQCDGQGRLLSVQRMNNGRVFGGYMHSSQEVPHTYRSCGFNSPDDKVVTNSGWLFRVDPKNDKKVDMFAHKRYGHQCYYKNPSYAMTWGGGHDLSCEQNFNHCYSNLGHNYGGPGADINTYNTGQNKNFIAGRYSWNARNDMSDYEVYLVKDQ